MFKFLTLITYREDGVDTCRGCVMDRSSSDFSLNVFTDIESLVQHWAKHRWNLPEGREFCETEYTLLIDGADPYTPHELEFEHEELRSQISKRLDEVLDDMNRVHKAHQAELEQQRKAKAALEAQAAARRKEEQERLELVRLQKLYGGAA